ncbi:GLPGLI family protein [Parapedobacter luteus]|uniref:GLPGLI family protein n=1 Tax=Parapedobacter luteus TaxID=623280 RepID=A0A1T5FTH7_9SPHI|nr:GLPGLI family protein [Parapedobacter luteus]SKB99446.1 GLPGLI family protein [Parapedobacter luteus]
MIISKFFIIGISILSTISFFLRGQSNRLIESGRIEFERSENVYSILDKLYDNPQDVQMTRYVENYKSNGPRFKTSSFILLFDAQTTLYSPKDSNEPVSTVLSQYSSYNIVHTDFKDREVTSQKNVLGVEYILKNKIREIKWRLTGETREIAGFKCRRANGLLADSIYVVAFYTDKIITKGGPESFTGLPGMILGLALPDEHITWFAKSYSSDMVNRDLQNIELKGRNINWEELDDIIRNSTTVRVHPNLLGFLRKRVVF